MSSKEFDMNKLKNLYSEDEELESTSFNHASFYDRFVAFRIDLIIMGVICVPIIFLVIYFLSYYLYPHILLLTLVLFLIIILDEFFYFFISEYLGNPPGKDFVDIKVVNDSRENITWKQSLIRNSERLIWVIPLFGQIFLYLSVSTIKTDDRRFGDIWAGTYVIEEDSHSKN